MKVSVIGNGRWGSFLAWYAAGLGHAVTLYGRAQSPRTQQLFQTRQNDYLTLPATVQLITRLEDILSAEVLLISVNSQGLRALLGQLAAIGGPLPLPVLCIKGLEEGTGKRLTTLVAEELGEKQPCAVWLGPGHVQQFVCGVPNCMVIDAASEADKRFLVEAFSGELIRFYYGEDLLGNELGAAAKNVVGIAAGMLDGYGLTSLKGALMSRGCREFARLIEAMGGNAHSAYGLCHLGDYEATVFSPHSHNRRFGESFVQNKPFPQLAEGCHTVKALMVLAAQTGVELPISQAVNNILYNHLPPRQALDSLFSRSLKQEFA